MLSVEQGCLSSKVDALPWSVRADLPNQSAEMKNITINTLGKTNKQAIERKWSGQRQVKANKQIHSRYSLLQGKKRRGERGGGRDGVWHWESRIKTSRFKNSNHLLIVNILTL